MVPHSCDWVAGCDLQLDNEAMYTAVSMCLGLSLCIPDIRDVATLLMPSL